METHDPQSGSETPATASNTTTALNQNGAATAPKRASRSLRRKRPPTLRLDPPASLQKFERLVGQLRELADKINQAMASAVAQGNAERAKAALAKAHAVLARAELTERLLARLILRSARIEALDLAAIPRVAEIASRALREIAQGQAAQTVPPLDQDAWRTLLAFATYFVLDPAPADLPEPLAKPNTQTGGTCS